MSNRIDSNHLRIANKTDSKVAESGQRSKVAPEGSAEIGKRDGKPANADTVVLTERSQMLERLEKKAASLPAVDPARVEAVKADIAAGKYRIDVDNIAEILLRTDRDIGD